MIGGLIWLLGLGSAMSFNVLSDFRFLINVDTDGDGIMDAKGTIFDNVDYLTSNIMLPLGGLLVAIYTAWIMAPKSTSDELEMGETRAYGMWQFTMRYITPIAIVIMFLKALGLI